MMIGLALRRTTGAASTRANILRMRANRSASERDAAENEAPKSDRGSI
jgi:Arc/MetJ family transcription regulator